jgi:hypothetical protein
MFLDKEGRNDPKNKEATEKIDKSGMKLICPQETPRNPIGGPQRASTGWILATGTA